MSKKSKICQTRHNIDEDHIIANLREVYDPEISVNVYDLGLIYNIETHDDTVKITATLTSAFCPFADEIVELSLIHI